MARLRLALLLGLAAGAANGLRVGRFARYQKALGFLRPRAIMSNELPTTEPLPPPPLTPPPVVVPEPELPAVDSAAATPKLKTTPIQATAEEVKLDMLRVVAAIQDLRTAPLTAGENIGLFGRLLGRRRRQRKAELAERRDLAAQLEAILDEKVKELTACWENMRYDAKVADGAWNLIYTRQGAAATNSQKAAGDSKGQQQIFDVANNSFENVVNFGTTGRSKVNARVAYEPVVPEHGPVERLDCTIDQAILQIRPWLRLPLPLRGKGWLDFIYLDSDLRITTGNRGSTFVHIKEGSRLNAVLEGLRAGGGDALGDVTLSAEAAVETGSEATMTATVPGSIGMDYLGSLDATQAAAKSAEITMRLKEDIANQLLQLKELQQPETLNFVVVEPEAAEPEEEAAATDVVEADADLASEDVIVSVSMAMAMDTAAGPTEEEDAAATDDEPAAEEESEKNADAPVATGDEKLAGALLQDLIDIMEE